MSVSLYFQVVSVPEASAQSAGAECVLEGFELGSQSLLEIFRCFVHRDPVGWKRGEGCADLKRRDGTDYGHAGKRAVAPGVNFPIAYGAFLIDRASAIDCVGNFGDCLHGKAPSNVLKLILLNGEDARRIVSEEF
jgi:hypothetical protein